MPMLQKLDFVISIHALREEGDQVSGEGTYWPY